MTDEQLAAMHRLLSEYHRKLATEAVLDVVQQYHADLAQRLEVPDGGTAAAIAALVSLTPTSRLLRS